MKLNLGSGNKHKEGYINIDIDATTKPDILRDVEKGLPFSDSVIDEIYTEHFLEHVNPDNIHFVMFEMWRVCKPGSLIKIIVPIGKGWINSPEHKTHFAEKSWIFFTKWNDSRKTGYDFSLGTYNVLRAKVNDLEPDSEGFGDELHFTLECIK